MDMYFITYKFFILSEGRFYFINAFDMFIWIVTSQLKFILYFYNYKIKYGYVGHTKILSNILLFYLSQLNFSIHKYVFGYK